jgi:hypothetical protein
MPLPPLTGFGRASLEIEGDLPIACWFNPTDFSITKTNSWEVKPVAGNPLPVAQFGGGAPRELSLVLFFDSTDSSELDVRVVTQRLFRMMEVGKTLGLGHAKNSGRPPMVTFTWGVNTPFKAVCKSLMVKYLLFRADGTPVRAQATLALTQAETAKDNSASSGGGKGQNPTTRARPGLGSHTVRDGDSLASIAFQHYRDPTSWRAIAEENGIDDPLHLKRGSVLSIPRIEQ